VPFLILFMNLGFILVAREVFSNLSTIVPILLLDAFICIDIIIRPISAKKDKFNRFISAISFLLIPIWFTLPYFEFKVLISKSLPSFILNCVSIIGTVLLVFGGLLLLFNRIHLGKYGGPKLVIEEEHQLITTGLYKFVRHPMYSGFLILFFGYSLAFGSILMTITITTVLFLIFKTRMDIEEKLLITEFGEEYSTYMKRTKRLFPLLY
ncbi:MAG: methyltransferase family protein, partial [Promethearchaeota archaeon]